MRIEKEESNLLRGEIRLMRDRREWQNVGIGLCLAAVNQVTGGAPALRQYGAMIGIGGHYRRPTQSDRCNDEKSNFA